jgi:ubiquinone/menaquinone biosynthesis C-methylase UbiE
MAKHQRLQEEVMFKKSYKYYDKIYDQKDYEEETQKLKSIIGDHLRSSGNRLLDVACGTGEHILHLKDHFEVEGLDLDPDLLHIAKEKNPEIQFHQADMMAFDLGKQFDILICLFSAIGYVKSLKNLNQAIGSMTQHLVPGGLLLVEPWFPPAAWTSGTVHTLFREEPDLHIVRMNTSFREGRISYFDFHFLIGTPEGTEHFIERHELGLFEAAETKEAFVSAGLEVIHDEEGIAGRGLHIGKKAL